jgi:hypothetical protein
MTSTLWHKAESRNTPAARTVACGARDRRAILHIRPEYVVDRSEEHMKGTPAPSGAGASKNITKRIAELGDWRGETLARMRQLIHDADPDVLEEWKWMGTPVWSHDGIICAGETYKQVVKLTFARGASLDDPKQLFNSSLEGNVRRAIDIREGETINAAAFKKLIRAAVAANSAALAMRASAKTKKK